MECEIEGIFSLQIPTGTNDGMPSFGCVTECLLAAAGCGNYWLP